MWVPRDAPVQSLPAVRGGRIITTVPTCLKTPALQLTEHALDAIQEPH